MSDQEPKKNDLIKFIAVTVETMRDQMATKSDLDQMAAKSDVDSLRDQVAYLGGQVETVRDQMGEMRDQMATKSDLAQLESRLTAKLEVEITAVRGDIEQIQFATRFY